MASYEMLGLLVKNNLPTYHAHALSSDPNIIPLPPSSSPSTQSHLTFSVPPPPDASFTTGSVDFDKQLCKIVSGAAINAARCASEAALLRSSGLGPAPSIDFGPSFESEFGR